MRETNLAKSLAFQGKLSEAAALWEHALPIYLAEHEDRALVVRVNTDYGFFLGQVAGRPADAEPVLLEALEIAAREIPTSHSQRLRAHNTLGSTYLLLGRDQDAETQFNATLELTPDLPPDDVWRGYALQSLIHVYERTGRTEDAARVRRIRSGS